MTTWIWFRVLFVAMSAPVAAMACSMLKATDKLDSFQPWFVLVVALGFWAECLVLMCRESVSMLNEREKRREQAKEAAQ